MKQKTTYVIGHKNPDTDSVCSAIAYAELCRAQGKARVSPARAGTLNRQTEFVLESLGQEPPELLADVYPRVRDVVGGAPITIHEEAPLSDAVQLMRRHDIRMLPVVDRDGRPGGALVLKRLPEHVFLPEEGDRIRQVLTSVQSILTCLRGKAVNLVDEERVDLLELYVGAMAAKTFAALLSRTDPSKAVVLTGDRIKVQMTAIEMGVRLLIVTGGLPVTEKVREAAVQKGISILVSPFDTATSALLTRMSTPVRHLADKGLPQVAPDDLLSSLTRLLTRDGAPGAVVLDHDGRVSGVATKTNLLKSSAIRLVLVDHNELSQAVPGADQVEILEVIDHHRLGNFHTETPIRFINQPLGSTCSVVATLYREAGISPEPRIAGLMLAGLLSDTVLLKSPTTTVIDRDLMDWLAPIAGLDPYEFGQQMFQSGSTLAEYPTPEALLMADFKEYVSGEQRFGVSQVEVVSYAEFQERIELLTEGLESLRRERGLGLVGLLVSDIVEQNSQLLVCGDSRLVSAIAYPQIAGGLFELKGVLSRKKQLVPHLLRAFRDL